MPAAEVDAAHRQWRTKSRGVGKGQGKGKGRYLFNHKALAKVFRAKLLAGIEAAGLAPPARHPREWVVDCKAVGSGQTALIYLGRYLYRGVTREADIVACADGQVTFRYRNATGKRERRTVSGAHFLWSGFTTCAAEGIPARPQFWLSAPQLQTLDRLAARGVAVRSWPGGHLDQGTRAHRLSLLWGGHEDRANADSSFVPGGKQGADCLFCYSGRACPTNGSDRGSLRSHELTLFVRPQVIQRRSLLQRTIGLPCQVHLQAVRPDDWLW